EQRDRRVANGFDRKWHSAIRKRALDRRHLGRGLTEAHQRKAAAKEVDDRAALGKPGMRRAAAGHRVGVIVLDRGMRGGARFVPADRGGVVAIAERKTIGDELASHARHDGVAHLAARALTLSSILKDLRRRLALAVALVAHIGMADVAAADRLAFGFLSAQEWRAAPPGTR